MIANGRRIAIQLASGASVWIRMPGSQPIIEPQVLRRYDGMPVLTSQQPCQAPKQ